MNQPSTDPTPDSQWDYETEAELLRAVFASWTCDRCGTGLDRHSVLPNGQGRPEVYCTTETAL